MKRSTIIVLAVFAILLVAAVIINDKPAQKGSERLDLAALDAEAVDSITIVSGEAERLELVRTEGVWRLADGHMADPETVERALEGLQSIDTSDVVSTSEERRSNYGVDTESGITVEAEAGSKRVARVVIGDAGGTGSYVRAVGKDPIFQTSRSIRHLFPTEVKRWLKLKLVDATLEEATRVEVKLANGHSFAIVPMEEGDEWAIADPSVLPADFRFDGPGARSLATTALSVRAQEIVDEAPDGATTGLEAEHDMITVVTEGGASTIHLGQSNDDNKVFARVDGRDALFLLPEYQAKNLRKQALDLRDLRLMSFPADDAVTLAIADGPAEYRFAKSEAGEWVIDPEATQPPADFAFDQASVARLVNSLTGVRASALVDDVGDSASGLNRPSPRVSVGFSDGTEVSLVFGKKTTGDDDATLYYARGNADEKLYTVAEYQRSRFTRGWELFKVVQAPPNMGGGNNPFANIDPETLKNLPPEVRESLIKQMREEQQKQQLMEQIRRQQGQ